MTPEVGLTETKAFKVWERRFSQKEISQKRKELGFGRPAIEAKIAKVTGWSNSYHHFPTDLSKWAVYQAPGAEGWQLFRCALKGLSTQHKLYFLDERWFISDAKRGKYELTYGGNTPQEELSLSAIECLRIYNYIGALRRGGLLDFSLNIIYRHKQLQTQSHTEQ